MSRSEAAWLGHSDGQDGERLCRREELGISCFTIHANSFVAFAPLVKRLS